MNIRDIIQNKYFEINQNKETFGETYSDYVITEVTICDYDVVEESVKETFVSLKNRAIATIKKIWKKMKEWMKKIIYNLAVFLIPTQKLVDKYKRDIVFLFCENSDVIKVNSCKYIYYPDTFERDFNSMIKGAKKIADDLLYEFDAGLFLSLFDDRLSNGKYYQLVDGKDTMNVLEDNVRQMAVNVLVKDPEVKLRELGDVMTFESFANALESKNHLKAIKKANKDVDGIFREIIQDIEHGKEEFNKKHDPNNEDEYSWIKKDRALFDKKIKWVKTLSKIMTIYVSTYVTELKKMNRFIMPLVKRLLRTVDPNDINVKKL